MNAIVIFSHYFITVGYVVQLLQNESPSLIAMAITYVGLSINYNWKMQYS
jgi:hypothetical protein